MERFFYIILEVSMSSHRSLYGKERGRGVMEKEM